MIDVQRDLTDIERTTMNPQLKAEFDLQHANCRRCHPELGRDWFRFAALLGIAGATVAFWIFGAAWCVAHYS